MALTAVGFDGSIDEVQWAKLAAALGTTYTVAAPNDLKVTTVAGQDRTVSIAAGTAVAHGVMVTNTAAATVQLPLVASGSRWDLVVLRRNWSGAGGTASLTYVQGTSVQTAAFGSKLSDPGVQDDQPLALVQITAGQQLPTAVIDVRVFAGRMLRTSSVLGLTVGMQVGSEAVVDDGKRYRMNSDGNLVQVVEGMRGLIGSAYGGVWDGFAGIATLVQGAFSVTAGRKYSVVYHWQASVGSGSSTAQAGFVFTDTNGVPGRAAISEFGYICSGLTLAPGPSWYADSGSVEFTPDFTGTLSLRLGLNLPGSNSVHLGTNWNSLHCYDMGA